MSFQKGDRVKFVNNSRNYRVGEANPLVGSKWECEGTVTRSGIDVRVSWDNGRGNIYKSKCLELIGTIKGDPNYMFKMKRR